MDERSPADLILFAQRFSQKVKYYTDNNVFDRKKPQEYNWLPFFRGDIAAILAGLSKLPVASFLSCYRGLHEYLDGDSSTSEPDLSNHFKLMFHLPLLLLKDSSEYYDLLPRDHALRTFMGELVKRDIEAPLRDLIAYYKGALNLSPSLFTDTPLAPMNYNVAFDDADPRIQLPTAVAERIADSVKLSEFFPVNGEFIMGIAANGWTALYNSVGANANPYPVNSSIYEQIYEALHYNLLANAFVRLFQAAERISLEAAKYFEDSLTDSEEHTPHYALWLAFLRLFRFNQDHINEFTERHLDYYLRDILQLCPRGPVPNSVHLLFELNKTARSHLLTRGTLFKAGKDARGNEVSYRLDSDFVINRAQVDSLKSLYIRTTKADGDEIIIPYASPVTNSWDGLGEKLPKEDPQWRPFGPESAPAARIGFAIADRQLFLREGKRSITVQAQAQTDLPVPAYLPSAFKAFFTGEKGWVELDPSKCSASRVDLLLEISVNLDGDDPAVVPFDSEIHDGGFDVVEPMLKIEFDFSQTLPWYGLLRNIQFTSIQLNTDVDNIRNFTLQNELGILDATKPFLPFGPTPAVKSQLTLGSSELFSKKVDKVTIDIVWEKALDDTNYFLRRSPSDYTFSAHILRQGTWESIDEGMAMFPTREIIGVAYTEYINLTAQQLQQGLWAPIAKEKRQSTFPVIIEFSNLEYCSDAIEQTLDNHPYSNASTGGFIRLLLNQDFGHTVFIDEKAKALIALARGVTEYPPVPSVLFNFPNNLPREPYTPKIVDMSISYSTVLNPPQQFFHLYPFGYKKVETTSSGQLFPKLLFDGELYIGIKDLDPPQRLSMLFQTVDGSANPLKPENTLKWHYLRDNEWMPLNEQSIDDKTNNLTGSGIIGIAVPEDANTEHTLMPSGLHWFRMSVEEDIDALNNLWSIDTQAASATFIDRGNDPAFVATPLAAGTISKLKVSDGSVKKITQPYASFGGKAKESSERFYVRASERLRHKDRASTMWDYEHLVLQHFPNIYKVKCINHTYPCRNNDILVDNEVRPGHVLVVTIPYVKAKGVDIPLRPYTDTKTLEAIAKFLRQRMSPFVKLEVQNPKFEEVQVKFMVAFHSEIADISFYTGELEKAIIRFLSPWAYDEGAEINFGGKWHKSSIINFIEEQPYVDYLKDFEMYHRPNIDQDPWTKIDEETIEATTARSILVSSQNHEVNKIEDTQ
ncbi:MAG TPA: hypothetical protein VN285_02130 [Candidatus Deferrimicrobium sp.]|nr:hypothetical protein [Candidatus Deferrimicrobium sp.]